MRVARTVWSTQGPGSSSASCEGGVAGNVVAAFLLILGVLEVDLSRVFLWFAVRGVVDVRGVCGVVTSCGFLSSSV